MENGDEIFMDYTVMGEWITKLADIAQILETVATVMEALSTTLKATALMGLIGGLAFANYLDKLRPIVERASEKAGIMSTNLSKSVEAFKADEAASASQYRGTTAYY